MPAPKPIGTIAASAGCPSEAAAICHSAVEEQPSNPILPFDQGRDANQSKLSQASVSGTPRISHSPSEKKRPRSFCTTYA